MGRCYEQPDATWLAQKNISDSFIGWPYSGQNGVLTNPSRPETSANPTTSKLVFAHPQPAQGGSGSAFSYVNAMRIYTIRVSSDVRRHSPAPILRRIATAICNKPVGNPKHSNQLREWSLLYHHAWCAAKYTASSTH